MRQFASGATRDKDNGKLDYEGFFSPLVLERRAQYMHKNRIQTDGELRPSDNWQKGIPFAAYMKSLYRHFIEVWLAHRKLRDHDIEEALCAVMFNAEGYLHELLKAKQDDNLELHLRVQREWAAAQSVRERAPGPWRGTLGFSPFCR